MNEKKEIRVAIFEDNPIMMDAYRSILNGSSGYVCTGSFSSCADWKHNIENSNPDLRIILQLIYKRKRVDFSHYKMNTIKRRMLRRMLIHKIKTIEQYAAFLEQTENEVELLFQD